MDYRAIVLSRIFPHRLEALEYAAERLTLDHFTGKQDTQALQRSLWAILVDYWSRYREVFPASYLTDLLQQNGVESSKILVLSNLYDSYCETEVSDGEFRAAVDQLRDYLDRYQTGAALTVAYDILERGITGEDGEKVYGHQAAREFFLREIAEIEERDVNDEAPEGDIRDEADRLVRMYEEVHGSEEIRGIEFGIPYLDSQTSGVQPGELCLIAAYSSEGKSQVCAQQAWHASVVQQRGVFFATTETVRDQTIRRILARHSRDPKFGLPNGLNSRDILKGSLSDIERRKYFDVIEDFSSTAAMCHISQMPAKATVDFVASRATRVNRSNRVDLILIDYLQLFEAPGRSRGEREDYNQILRSSKRLAASFDNGRAVAVVSPWQINKQAYKEALEAQSYTLASLADTSEAEKSPDLVITLLRPSEESHLGKMQGLKLRDSPKIPPFDVEVDYRNSFIGDTGSSLALPGQQDRGTVFEQLGGEF